MALFGRQQGSELTEEPHVPTRQKLESDHNGPLKSVQTASERPTLHSQQPQKKGFFSRLHELSPFAHQDHDDLEGNYAKPSPSLNGNSFRETEAQRPARVDAQPRLVGVQGGKPAQSKDKTFDEDLLDIPAFLRRQAN